MKALPFFVTTLAIAVACMDTRAADPLPPLALQDLHGAPFSLTALRDKVVVLDVWAPWCAPCRKSFPFLNELQSRHTAEGLVVVGLTLDDDGDAIRAFLESVPAAFPVARDPSGSAGNVLGIVAMPTTLLIDREGRVAARFEGGDESVHAKIAEAAAILLAGGALPPGAGVRVATGLAASGGVQAWDRGYLADPIMSLDGDPLTRAMREHIHASKEAASGDGGASGGGCGCN